MQNNQYYAISLPLLNIEYTADKVVKQLEKIIMNCYIELSQLAENENLKLTEQNTELKAQKDTLLRQLEYNKNEMNEICSALDDDDGFFTPNSFFTGSHTSSQVLNKINELKQNKREIQEKLDQLEMHNESIEEQKEEINYLKTKVEQLETEGVIKDKVISSQAQMIHDFKKIVIKSERSFEQQNKLISEQKEIISNQKDMITKQEGMINELKASLTIAIERMTMNISMSDTTQ